MKFVVKMNMEWNLATFHKVVHLIADGDDETLCGHDSFRYLFTDETELQRDPTEVFKTSRQVDIRSNYKPVSLCGNCESAMEARDDVDVPDSPDVHGQAEYHVVKRNVVEKEKMPVDEAIERQTADLKMGFPATVQQV